MKTINKLTVILLSFIILACEGGIVPESFENEYQANAKLRSVIYFDRMHDNDTAYIYNYHYKNDKLSIVEKIDFLKTKQITQSSYFYNENGLLDSISPSNKYFYNKDNLLDSVRSDKTVTKYTYNSLNKIYQIITGKFGPIYTYEYDGKNRVSIITRREYYGMTVGSETYAYDQNDSVLTVTYFYSVRTAPAQYVSKMEYVYLNGRLDSKNIYGKETGKNEVLVGKLRINYDKNGNKLTEAYDGPLYISRFNYGYIYY